MRLAGMTPTLVKLGFFVLVTVLCTVLVGNTLYRPLGQSTTTYQAAITDVVGLQKGSDVRIAGVRVGRVNALELTGDHATVTFEVTDDQVVPADVEAHVRYADLLGARYIALRAGGGTSERLPEGSVIGLERTRPAVDLTDLFNGFAPVFNTLAPSEINKLATELVAVFQGEGGTIESLLGHVVVLTNNVADQDELIGEVLTNLRSATDFALRNEPNFTKLIDSLAGLAAGMARSKDDLGAAIDASSDLARSLSGLITDIRPALDRDMRALNRVAGTLVKNTDNFENSLESAHRLFHGVNRASEYGAWLNVYLCRLVGETGLPVLGEIGADVGGHSEVCRP